MPGTDLPRPLRLWLATPGRARNRVALICSAYEPYQPTNSVLVVSVFMPSTNDKVLIPWTEGQTHPRNSLTAAQLVDHGRTSPIFQAVSANQLEGSP